MSFDLKTFLQEAEMTLATIGANILEQGIVIPVSKHQSMHLKGVLIQSGLQALTQLTEEGLQAAMPSSQVGPTSQPEAQPSA